MNRFIISLFLLSIILGGCSSKPKEQTARKGDKSMSMKVTSPAFKEGDMIPAKYTADGRDISPPLKIEELPAGTQSIVIIIR